VDALLFAGADPNSPDKKGQTPLIQAVERGHLDIVNALRAAGADPNIADNDGITSLIQAAHKGHLDIVHELLAVGANPNLADNDGKTPLYHAELQSHTAVAELLREAIAKISQATRQTLQHLNGPEVDEKTHLLDRDDLPPNVESDPSPRFGNE
jgi:ankyrin repeat protein